MRRGLEPKILETKYSPDYILRFAGEDFVEKSADIEEMLSTVERWLE